MIEIHFFAFNKIKIEAIAKVLSITKNVGGSAVSWRVDFVDTNLHINHWYLYGEGRNDGLKFDDEFHGPDDADWEVWVAKYNHNIEVEGILENL